MNIASKGPAGALASGAGGKGQAEDPFDSAKVNVTINSRLFDERRRQLLAKSPDKTTLTGQIFGERQYFTSAEDTSKNQDMQDYVAKDW